MVFEQAWRLSKAGMRAVPFPPSIYTQPPPALQQRHRKTWDRGKS